MTRTSHVDSNIVGDHMEVLVLVCRNVCGYIQLLQTQVLIEHKFEQNLSEVLDTAPFFAISL